MTSASGGVTAPYPPREFDRLASPVGLRLEATEEAPPFDAAAGAVTIVREHGETFLGNRRMPYADAPREDSLCATTILSPVLFVVEDLDADPRFARKVHVVGDAASASTRARPSPTPRTSPWAPSASLNRRPRAAPPGALSVLQSLASRAAALLEARRLPVELLGHNPHPVALHAALDRVDATLSPFLADEPPALRAAA